MLVPPTFVTVSEGHRLAVRRGGHGGVPLLLLHGFPCTSLIWSHNVEPLAAVGFDVAAPDLRGYGDSDFAPDGFYDFAAFNADLIGLLDALGWERAVVAGNDLGAMVAIDLANRHPDRVDRLVVLDDSMPDLPDAFAAAGIPPGTPKPAIYDYQRRQGLHADELVAERCAVAYPQVVGPFWVPGAGHFMPWEKPTVVNRAIRAFCGDLLATRGGAA
ncbi:alpha/beta fold hydrolase [Streptosporangium roseum]|uniref:alpha/beta fold hydrolase n=1 Tax=Streptosporangium roseum TaxID=2001 RepID=UPI00332ED5FA